MESKNLLTFRMLKGISDFQFGSKVTDILFEDKNNLMLEFSKNTDRIRYVYNHGDMLLSFRPNNGYLTLSFLAAKMILHKTAPPQLRAVVQNDISEFIRKGRNVFCKHIKQIDENLRPMDEVIIVNEDDSLLAIGRLKLPISYIKAFNYGIAIIVRKGFNL